MEPKSRVRPTKGWSLHELPSALALSAMATLLVAGLVAAGPAAANERWVTSQVTDNVYADHTVQVSQDRLAWSEGYGAGSKIFTWKAGDTAPTPLTDNAYGGLFPQVSGDRVVWEVDEGDDNEIFTWKAGDTAPTRLTDNAEYYLRRRSPATELCGPATTAMTLRSSRGMRATQRPPS